MIFNLLTYNMSTKKLGLATAVQNFKKGINARNVKHTESEIADFIDEQIELKLKEIETIKKQSSKIADQNNRDFKDSLVMLDEEAITSVSSRQAYAQRYVLNAVSYMKRNEDYVKFQKEAVEKLNNQIENLKTLRTTLETITVEVETAE